MVFLVYVCVAAWDGWGVLDVVLGLLAPLVVLSDVGRGLGDCLVGACALIESVQLQVVGFRLFNDNGGLIIVHSGFFNWNRVNVFDLWGSGFSWCEVNVLNWHRWLRLLVFLVGFRNIKDYIVLFDQFLGNIRAGGQLVKVLMDSGGRGRGFVQENVVGFF